MDHAATEVEPTRLVMSRAIPALSIVILAALCLSLTLGTKGQEIAPNYDDSGSAFAISVVIGLACLGLLLATAPREAKQLLSALGWSVLVALLSFPTMLVILGDVHQRSDFAGSRISEHMKYLSIDSAQIHRGRGGVHYEVELTGLSGLLNIDERDYRSAFGSAERIKPVGYCVLATVQTAPIIVDDGPNMPMSARRSAVAVRVIDKNGFDLPARSLVRCPQAKRATTPVKQ